MGSQLVEKFCRVQLPPTEKLILLAYAHRTRDNDPEAGAWPSIESLMQFACCGRRTAARAVAKLKKEEFLIDTGKRKGETGQIKAYRPNSAKGGTVEQCQRRHSEQCHLEGCNSAKGGIQNTKEHQVVEKDATAAAFSKQMEEDLVALWNYHQSAFDRDDKFTPQRQRQGFARLREAAQRGNQYPGYLLSEVIDLAKDIHKRTGKWFMTEWHCLFGKPSTCTNLLAQYAEMDSPPPSAAEWTGRTPE